MTCFIKTEVIKSIEHHHIPEDLYMIMTFGEGAPNDTQFRYHVREDYDYEYEEQYRKVDDWLIEHGAERGDTITVEVSW